MNPGKLSAFILLILGGHICLPLLVLTFAFARSVKRRSITLINLLLSIIVYATALLLLFYAGQADNGSPPFVLCRLQSALFHGSAPMISTAGLGLIIETAELVFTPHPKRSYLKLAVLLGAPWLILIGFFIAFFCTGLQMSPDTESLLNATPFFYCRFPTGGILDKLNVFITLFSLLLIIILEGFILAKMMRLSRSFRVAEKPLTIPLLDLLLRGAVVTIFISVELCAVFFYNTYSAGNASYIIISLPPIGNFLIFGTQRDVLRAWFLCGRGSMTDDWSEEENRTPTSSRGKTLP